MMNPTVSAMTPDERIGQSLCPECGIPLAGMSGTAHAATHWPPHIIATQYNGESFRRQRMLFDYDEQHGVK